MKAGIVGCGGIADVHGAILSGMEDVELACAADIILDHAAALTEKYGGRPYETLEEMLRKEDIQVLHICTPHALHTPMACLAAEKGIAIFTEKPPVINREQWAKLQKAASKVPLGICFQNRYNGSVRRIKEILESRTMGRLLGARGIVTWKREKAYYAESSWRGTWELEGGGALMNQAVHTLDLLVYFLGRPDSVSAGTENFHLKGIIDVEDTMTARMEYGECPVLFYATTAHCLDAPVIIDLYFEHGRIRMEDTVVTVNRKGRKEEEDFTEKAGLGKDYWGSGHESCIRDYYKKVALGEAAPVGLKEIGDTVEVLLAMYESACLQCRVDMVQ